MTDSTSDLQYQKTARIAGLLFILNLIVPLLNWSFILSPLNVEGNRVATAQNIIENESLFRIGITVELFMSIGLILLAVTLYQMLKPANRSLALLAFSIKIVEATLMAVTVLIPFVALQISNGDDSFSIFTQDQLLYPIGAVFNSHTALTSIPMVFLGLDMMLFSYLFFKTEFIHKWLAGFGFLSFALIFIHAIMFIVAPLYAVKQIIQIIFWSPSGLFEIIVGLKLMIKGINISHEKI